MKHFNYILYFFFVLFIGTFSINAQNTKIKDGSMEGTSITPVENTILELESKTKGFLMPRMTNNERDAISINTKSEGNGLTIYNTDTDCINYWSNNNNRWMSLCGTLPPANISVDATNCNNLLFVNGRNGTNKLKQGEYLTPSDILYVDLTVGEIGHYDITAVTDNGYYFSATGTFNAKGAVRIPLTGVGVPVDGSTGDKVKFSINGKTQDACSNFTIEVEKAGINFTVTSATVNALGDYLLNVPVNQKTNYVNVDVNVIEVGAYTIKTTQAVNGLSFSGAGIFTKTGVQTVKLVAEGTPKTTGTATLSIQTNSNGGNNKPATKINATVKAVDYSVDLAKTTKRGQFIKGKKLTNDSFLIVEVLVKAPGKTDLTITSGNVTFSAKDVNLEYKVGASNLQKVRLYSTSTLPNETNVTFAAKDKFLNSYKLDLQNPPVEYTINCSSLKTVGTYYAGVEIINNDKNYVEVEIDVKVAGQTTIVTDDEVNGIRLTFDGEVKFGKQKIKLSASGTPKKVQNNVQLRLFSTDLGGLTNCFAKIDVKNQIRQFNILVIGDDKYSPSKSGNATYRILNNRTQFGPNGKVKVERIRYYDYFSKRIASTPEGEQLYKYIIDKEIDIVFVTQGAKLNTYGIVALSKFVNTDNGVLILSSEDEPERIIQAIKAIGGGYPSKSSAGMELHNQTFSNGSPVLNGPFGNIQGLYLGNDFYNGEYFNSIPATMTPIAFGYRQGEIWAAHHNEKGFAFIGDGGWMHSGPDISTRAPLTSSGIGVPTTNNSYGPLFVQKNVENGRFFANLMAWAIERRKENTK